MNFLKNIFSSIGLFFASPKGKQAVDTINTLVEVAMPIVIQISAMTGNVGAAASIAVVKAAYDKYGVPLEQTLVAGNQTQIGNALQNLAVAVLQKTLPADKASTASNLLVTAVNLAVSASKVGI